MGWQGLFLKGKVYEVYHSSLSSVEVKNMQCYTCTSLVLPTKVCRYRDYLTFVLVKCKFLSIHTLQFNVNLLKDMTV
jgi:hypothetical protein